jgi:hypothetical protein
MSKSCMLRGRPGFAFFMRCIIDTVQATTRPGSTLHQFTPLSQPTSQMMPVRLWLILSLLSHPKALLDGINGRWWPPSPAAKPRPEAR